jgi:hypothetical protein
VKNLTYDTFLRNPDAALQQVRAEAARERALAVQRYLIAPALRLCGRLLAIRGPRFQLDPRWVAR